MIELVQQLAPIDFEHFEKVATSSKATKNRAKTNSSPSKTHEKLTQPTMETCAHCLSEAKKKKLKLNWKNLGGKTNFLCSSCKLYLHEKCWDLHLNNNK